MYKDQGTGGNYSSPCGTPFLERSRAHQSGVTPPPHITGFAAAVMRQQWHQCGIERLTCHVTHLENEVHQAMAVLMNADVGKLSSIQAVNEKHEVQESIEPIVGQ